jgi:adenosylmethionine-8-amino-7-oxononanoate aminotransferase
MKREGIVEHVREHEERFRATLSQLLVLPIAGDLRGTGFFYALVLVKDKETRETFTDEESEYLLRGFLSPRLFKRDLICRAALAAARRWPGGVRSDRGNPGGRASRGVAGAGARNAALAKA